MADPATSLQITVEAKDQTTHVLKGIESSIIRFVGAVSATLASISVVLFPIKQAADFQKELLDVGKTTEFSTEKLDKLAEGLKQMSYRLNVSAVDLAKVAAAGGQLGLGKEGVEGLLLYTEATSRFSSVLNVSVEEAGTAIGKLSNLFGISIRDAERISSTINEISNNSTASGAELLDIIQRIGTAGGTLTLQQSAALAAYGKDLGLTSETVGTTLNKIFLDLQTKAAQVAPLVGLPVREFADLVKTDGVAAFKLYINALEKMDNITRSTLSEQITGGGRIAAFVTATLNDASTGFTLLDKELAKTNDGWRTGTSAINEQARVLSGLWAQVEIVKNVFLGIAETVGKQALPYLTKLAEQIQAFGKDPTVIAWFVDLGNSIGASIAGFLEFAKSLSSMSAVMGPVLQILRVWLGLKVLETLMGWGKSLYATAQATAAATTGWLNLITVNKQAILTMAEAAAQARKTNAEIAASGKTPDTKVSVLGQAATGLSALFKPYWDAQAESLKTEKLLNDRIAQRDTILKGITTRMQEIQSTTKALAQQAYDDAIAAGSSKKAANTIKRDVSVALKKEYDSLDVRGANLFNSYETSINRLGAAHQRAAASAVAMSGTIGGMLARIAAGARAAAVAVFAIGESFLAVASRILGVVFIVQFLLDILGLLDPVLKGLRYILGIRTEEEAAATRAAAARDKALVDERNRAKELAAEYDKVAVTWGKALPNDRSTGLAATAAKLEIITGKMADMAFSAGEFTAGIAYSASAVQTLTAQLEQAKRKYAELQKSRETTQAVGVVKETVLPALFSDISSDKANREIEKARQEVDKLATSLDLAKKAQQYYTTELSKVSGVNTTLAKQEQEVIAQLANAYDAEGYSMVKALQLVVTKRKELADAEKEEADARRASEATGASNDQITAYTIAASKVRTLKAEVDTLDAAYANMKGEASLAALAFTRSLGIDETTASIEKLNNVISIFGGISGTTIRGIEQRLADVTKEANTSQKALSSLELARTQRINNLKAAVPDPNADNIKIAEQAITAEFNAQAAAIRAKLQAQLAIKSNTERELASAKSLAAAYDRGGTAVAKAKQQSAALMSSFLSDTATVTFVNKQLEAQKRIVDGATFHAKQVKDAYEAATKEVAKSVEQVATDMQSLVSYFAGRKLTLKLAAFDSNYEQANKFFNDIQQDQLAAEKKRLETLGLSSQELKDQTRALEQMYEWATKMRQSAQDEQRQTLILNDIRAQINSSYRDSVTAQEKATQLAKEAKAAATAGNKDQAISLGEQAAIEAEKAKGATEELTAKVKEFKAEAAKPVNILGGAKFLVADQEITDLTQKAAEARVTAAKAVSNALEQAYQSASDGLQRENAVMAAMNTKVEQAQQRIASVIQLVPELARVQGLVGEALLKQVSGIDAVSSSLQSIATQDFRGLTEFGQVSAQAPAFKEIEQSIHNMAQGAAGNLAEIATKAKELPAALREMYQITTDQLAKADAAAAADAMRKSVASAAPMTGKVEFPGARDSLQQSLDNGPPLKAKVEVSSTGTASAKGYATGGHIQGPGTGTSDSILAWLSNGEFVNDAKTTSFFGPAFFSLLKSIAHGGRSAMSNLVASFGGGPRIPAFATGGYVGMVSQFDPATVSGSGKELDSVRVDLGVGDSRYQLTTERDTAKSLVKALHNIGRSVL